MADRDITMSLHVRPDVRPAQQAMEGLAAATRKAAEAKERLRQAGPPGAAGSGGGVSDVLGQVLPGVLRGSAGGGLGGLLSGGLGAILRGAGSGAAAGGAAGAAGLGAAAGPVGLIAGALPILIKKLEENRTLQLLQMPMRLAMKPLHAAQKVISDPVGAAVDAFDTLKRLIQGMLPYVQLSNPGTVQRLQRAQEDLAATIGQRFAPIVDTASEAVRALGDVLANMLPDADDVREVMNELRPAIQEVKKALLEVAPVVKDVLKNALHGLAVTIHNIVQTAQIMGAFVRLGRTLLGIKDQPRDLPDATSRGAALRGVHYNQFSDILLENVKNAFLMGQEDRDPQKQLKTSLDDLRVAIENLTAALTGVGKAAGGAAGGITGAVGGLWDSLKGGPGAAVEWAVQQALGGAVRGW
jgi:hypothetical protein